MLVVFVVIHTCSLCIKLRGYCGWAVAGLLAKVHEADQDSQSQWDHLWDRLDYLAWHLVS